MSVSGAINLGELSDIDEEIGTGIFFVYSSTYFTIFKFRRPSTGESRVSPDQPDNLQGGWGFTDPSGPLFSMHLDMAEGHDKKKTDRWKADADRILIFVSGHIHQLSILTSTRNL